METSVDKSALLSLKAEDKYEDENEEQELLSGGGSECTVDHFANAPMDDCADEIEDNADNAAVNQFSDSDDMDDDDLLTSDLNQRVITSIEPAPTTVGGEINDWSAFHDDDEFSDEDLLTD